MSDRAVFIYTLFGSADEARQVAKTLLEEKLIACANHLPPALSQYIWKGNFVEETEYPVLLKSHDICLEQAMTRTKELHSFEKPAILSWPADKVDLDYVKWIEAQVMEG